MTFSFVLYCFNNDKDKGFTLLLLLPCTDCHHQEQPQEVPSQCGRWRDCWVYYHPGHQRTWGSTSDWPQWLPCSRKQICPWVLIVDSTVSIASVVWETLFQFVVLSLWKSLLSWLQLTVAKGVQGSDAATLHVDPAQQLRTARERIRLRAAKVCVCVCVCVPMCVWWVDNIEGVGVCDVDGLVCYHLSWKFRCSLKHNWVISV